jgi:hypothetical protein
MAWENFSHNDIDCFTGDIPWDEFSLALSEIAVQYEDRFGRKPRIIELITAFQSSISHRNTFDLEENEYVKIEYKIVNLEKNLSDRIAPSNKKINLEAIYDFEGAYTDRAEPGYYLIFRKSNLTFDSQEEDCIEIPKLGITNDILVCDFKILTNDLDNEDAHKFIRKYLLEKFSDNYYEDKASMIKFTNIASGETSLHVMKIPV